MWVVLFKFTEVGSRAAFIVLTSYSLGLAEAGQFGLIVTFQGLASFAFGYERHTDIQRRYGGADPAVFDAKVASALRLFVLNYAAVIPLFVLVLAASVYLPAYLIALCVVIAVAEQLMNQAYQMSMVNQRYFPLLCIAVAKNCVILLSVLWVILFSVTGITLVKVLEFWALWSGVAGVILAGAWLWVRQSGAGVADAIYESLWAQYKASWGHFLLGLVAIIVLQIDRLVLGVLLPLEDVGVYFRHILLVSLLYQVFNIAFHNRVLPTVFKTAQAVRADQAPRSSLPPLVKREYLFTLVFVACVSVIGLAIHWITVGSFADKYHLQPIYFVGLLMVAVTRMRADFNGLVLNAMHREYVIFRLQLLAFGMGLPVLIGLTLWIGIPGTIIAGFLTALVYLGLTYFSLKSFLNEDPHVR